MHTTLGLALLLWTAADGGADWPEFKGPARTSVVDALETEFAWPEEGPPILWTTAVGPGYGGPAVVGDEVFLLDREVGVRDVLRVLDLATGEERWTADYPAEGRVNFAGSRSVPSVGADLVVTCGGLGHVAAFDREERALAWLVDLEAEYGGRPPMFGWSAAPLVVGDLVIVTPLGDEVGLLALDRRTGEKVWSTGDVGFSHSTPTLLTLLGKPQIVFLSTTYGASGRDEAAPTTISSFDPATGALLWRTETLLTRLPIPGPVGIDDERFFVTGGYRGGSTMMKIASTEEGFAFEELFHIDRGSQTHAPLLHGDHLYLLVNENWNHSSRRRSEGGLMCLGLDGQERWRTGAEPYIGRGNAILAGDRLLIQDGFDGTLRVVEAAPEAYRLVAETRPFLVDGGADGRMWAPMALAGGRLLMRSQDQLVCLRP